MAESAAGAPETRAAMSRSFTRSADGRWTDARFSAGIATVKVAPYSEAYFALLRELPALQEALSLGEHVLIAGRGVALEIAEGGQSTLTRNELARIVQAMR